jgi:putative NIF3 family GTP cyclohydrolase 1 type 2
VLKALRRHHEYEEIAFELVPLDNLHQEVGSGIIGELSKPVTEKAFMTMVKGAFKCKMLRHTAYLGKKVQKVAVCGGSGSFLTQHAIAAGADAYISADYKYHEFFDADGKLLIIDIGHYESEQFTIDLIFRYLRQKITTFAVQKTKISTNSVHYFV